LIPPQTGHLHFFLAKLHPFPYSLFFLIALWASVFEGLSVLLVCFQTPQEVMLFFIPFLFSVFLFSSFLGITKFSHPGLRRRKAWVFSNKVHVFSLNVPVGFFGPLFSGRLLRVFFYLQSSVAHFPGATPQRLACLVGPGCRRVVWGI